jgi:hypothetical protein
MNCGRGRGRGRGRGARGGRGAGGGVEEAAPVGPQPNVDMTAILAEMQSMRAEMNAMCQAGASTAVGAAPTGGDDPISANDEGGGVAQPRGAPQQYLDLRDWCGMSLEQFAGTGAPIETADWLSAATEKLDAFRIPQTEWVRYATQLLKGEALVWWRNVQSSHSIVQGPITWGEFVNQFEMRFYLVAFTDKIKTQLERCHQGKKIVAEYEVEFNQIVRFIPHVGHNEYEKARIFHQGLKASIRQVLGAFVLKDFRSVVERALGVEV